MNHKEIDELTDALRRYCAAIGPNAPHMTATTMQAIACIRELQSEIADARKTAETQCQIRYAETEEIERLQRENAELRAIVADLHEETDCRFDHHGHCQEHLWFADDGTVCPNRRARDYLQREDA